MKLIKIKIAMEAGIRNFHNVGSIIFYAAPEQLKKEQGEEGLIFFLSPAQARRLEKHFCGMETCCCDSGPARYYGCWPEPAIYVKDEWIKSSAK